MKIWLSLISLLALVPQARAGFVQARSGHFELDGKPYRFVGANLWYGMNLGMSGDPGDRKRLRRELDRLEAIGVTNLRVLGTSQGPDGDPERISPTLEPRPGEIDKRVSQGLDFLLSQMRKRHMHAVVVLNNFWPWSGGMAQYLSWLDGSKIPGWPEIQAYSFAFYSNVQANAAADALIAMVVRRHANDRGVMAWELANEPRGGAAPAAMGAWIDRTAAFIKSLDRNHLVTTGSEGDTPFPDCGNDLERDHASPNIDYVTIHVWAQNWGWYSPTDSATFEPAIAKMKAYIAGQSEKARALGKPLVIEEFGLARDESRYDSGSPTTARDRYFRELFETALSAGIAGTNFWAWGGEGRPRTPGGHWRPGDAFIGEPPPENQGWYSVYDTDASTLRIVSDYAARFACSPN